MCNIVIAQRNTDDNGWNGEFLIPKNKLNFTPRSVPETLFDILLGVWPETSDSLYLNNYIFNGKLCSMSSLYIFRAILNQLRKRVLWGEEELWDTRHNIHIIINTIPEFIYEEEEEALVYVGDGVGSAGVLLDRDCSLFGTTTEGAIKYKCIHMAPIW